VTKILEKFCVNSNLPLCWCVTCGENCNAGFELLPLFPFGSLQVFRAPTRLPSTLSCPMMSASQQTPCRSCPIGCATPSAAAQGMGQLNNSSQHDPKCVSTGTGVLTCHDAHAQYHAALQVWQLQTLSLPSAFSCIAGPCPTAPLPTTHTTLPSVVVPG
jgi:hypothetical protein